MAVVAHQHVDRGKSVMWFRRKLRQLPGKSAIFPMVSQF
jgi:hypothetical protein